MVSLYRQLNLRFGVPRQNYFQRMAEKSVRPPSLSWTIHAGRCRAGEKSWPSRPPGRRDCLAGKAACLSEEPHIWPPVTPPPANQIVLHAPQWSRPAFR
jgi:hypothetical protein